MSEDVEDVRRALTIVFRGTDGLAQADLERAFSFDMEWVAPHEAEDVVNALLASGWITQRDQKFCLAVELGEVRVPFGWFPRPTRLLRPVSASASKASEQSGQTPSQPQQTPTTVSTSSRTEANMTGDPRARLTHRVARFIARQSGLELEELQRRVDRKVKTFHIITPWMAYALVAREQGLPMDDIVRSLDVA